MEKEVYKIVFELENYHWWYVGYRELVEKYLKKEHRKLEIFDAGCGCGGMLTMLEKYGNAEGVDFSDIALNFAKSRGLKNVSKADLNFWKSEKKYDLIHCSDVLYHKNIENDVEILQKFFDSLQKDGLLILSLPAFAILSRQHDKAVFGVRRYRKNKMVKILENIGFRIEKASYRFPYVFLAILLVKCMEFFYRKKSDSVDIQHIPRWWNKIWLTLNRLENSSITLGIPVPFGSTLFIVARK